MKFHITKSSQKSPKHKSETILQNKRTYGAGSQKKPKELYTKKVKIMKKIEIYCLRRIKLIYISVK